MLNHEEIKNRSSKNNKIKLFVNKYNRVVINFPSEKDDWKKFNKNNVTIAVTVLHAKREKKYILLMFQNITQIKKNKLFF